MCVVPVRAMTPDQQYSVRNLRKINTIIAASGDGKLASKYGMIHSPKLHMNSSLQAAFYLHQLIDTEIVVRGDS
jgi:hypothetical protein